MLAGSCGEAGRVMYEVGSVAACTAHLSFGVTLGSGVLLFMLDPIQQGNHS